MDCPKQTAIFIKEAPALIIREVDGNLVACIPPPARGRDSRIDGIFLDFYDDGQMVVHVQSVSEPNEKTGYKGGFKTRFLYSIADSGEKDEKNQHTITTTGYCFEGPVKFRLGKDADYEYLVDIHHIRVDEEREKQLNKLFGENIEGLGDNAEPALPLHLKMAAYHHYVRQHYMEDRLFEEHLKRLHDLAAVPFPSLIDALKSYDSIRKNLPVLSEFFS